MSLIPYSDDSLILNDPNSKSLMIVNAAQGTLSVFQEVPTTQPVTSNLDRRSLINFDYNSQLERYNNIHNNDSSNATTTAFMPNISNNNHDIYFEDNINDNNTTTTNNNIITGRNKYYSIATFSCPHCGAEISDGNKIKLSRNNSTRRPSLQSLNDRNYNNINDLTDNLITNVDPIDSREMEPLNSNQLPHFHLSPRYFQFLQNTHKHYSLPSIEDDSKSGNNNKYNRNYKNKTKGLQKERDFQSFIPEELFIPGYFHKFFTTLSLLGNGARGSVFKVIHRIGNTSLGVFALKKISIGNDMVWFNKCIREVKALSSLTHKSANLITYNHVWLEMDKSYGVTTKMNSDNEKLNQDSINYNKDDDLNEKIPCLFILQQYCPGGNLEDCILIDVFKKYPERISPEERKKWFKEVRRIKRANVQLQLGLSTLQILHIIQDIARGLHELHDIGLIHRDLKPSNCLLLSKYKDEIITDDNKNNVTRGKGSLTNNFDIKEDRSNEMNPSNKDNYGVFPTVIIGDLGESQLLGEARTATGATGTIEYTAPEVIINDKLNQSVGTNFPMDNDILLQYNEYTFASDMYSFGMIVYFIVFGKLPFILDSFDIPEMKRTVKSFKINKLSMIKEHNAMNLKPIDYRIFDVIESLLSVDPTKRPTAKQLEEYASRLILNLSGTGSDNNIDINNTNNNYNNNYNDVNPVKLPTLNPLKFKKTKDCQVFRPENNIYSDADEVTSIESSDMDNIANNDPTSNPFDLRDNSPNENKEYLALLDNHQSTNPSHLFDFTYNKYYQKIFHSSYIYIIISIVTTALIYFEIKKKIYLAVLNLLSMFLLGLSVNSDYGEAKIITIILMLLYIVLKVF